MDPVYVGQILLWPIQWAPEGWALCNGQQVLINEYPSLYSLIQNSYGNGSMKGYFHVPNLPGITIAGTGTGPGLNINYPIGDVAVGSPTTILTSETMPAHNHLAEYNLTSTSLTANLQASASIATASNASSIASAVPATGATNNASVPANLYGPATSPVQLSNAINAGLISNIGSMTVQLSTGAGSGHDNMQPYLNLYYIIALNGNYPEFD